MKFGRGDIVASRYWWTWLPKKVGPLQDDRWMFIYWLWWRYERFCGEGNP